MQPAYNRRSLLISAFAVFCSLNADAALIFDDSYYGDQVSHQVPGNMSGGDNGLIGKITVSGLTVITNFSVFTAQDGPGRLKFLVYDQTTSNFLYTSAPVAVAGDDLNAGNPFSAKLSPTFALTLSPTDTYYFGATADSGTYYLIGASNNPDNPPGPAQPVTQNGITGTAVNLLVGNYANPTIRPGGTAELSIQIFNGVVNTPEPATWTMVILSFCFFIAIGGRGRIGGKAVRHS